MAGALRLRRQTQTAIAAMEEKENPCPSHTSVTSEQEAHTCNRQATKVSYSNWDGTSRCVVGQPRRMINRGPTMATRPRQRVRQWQCEFKAWFQLKSPVITGTERERIIQLKWTESHDVVKGCGLWLPALFPLRPNACCTRHTRESQVSCHSRVTFGIRYCNISPLAFSIWLLARQTVRRYVPAQNVIACWDICRNLGVCHKRSRHRH